MKLCLNNELKAVLNILFNSQDKWTFQNSYKKALGLYLLIKNLIFISIGQQYLIKCKA